MNQIAAELGLSSYFNVDGVPVNLNYITRDKSGQPSLSFRTLFSQEMIKAGVLIPWIAISYSHTETELDLTLEAVRKSLQVYKLALDAGVEKYLVGPAIKPVFRQFN
jgi:glutamate-1-semialdehyde 2,1-aminomutase